MTMAGPNIVLYSLTQYGSQKASTGAPIATDPTTRHVFKSLVKLGGMAELRELESESQVDPATIQVALSNLGKLGLIAAQQQQVQTYGQGSMGLPQLPQM